MSNTAALPENKLRTIMDFGCEWEEKLFHQSRHPLEINPARKLTLIFPDTDQAPTVRREFLLYTPSEGVSYIATVAKNAGWDVEIIDLRLEGLDLNEAARKAATRGGVLAIPTFVDSVPQNLEILNLVKTQNPEICVVVGGALVSSLPEPICQAMNVDYAVLKEGEVTFLELLDHIAAGRSKAEAQHIKGLAIRTDDGHVIQTLPRPQLKTLDSVPIPDLFLYPSVKTNPSIPEMGLTTARGCYGRCTFCFVNIPKMKFKSIERVDEELHDLVEKHGTNYLYLNDLTFTADMKRTWYICDVLERYGIQWSCSTRVEKCDPELLKHMRETGCQEIWYGVESLDQYVLDLVQKRQTLQQIMDAVNMTLDSGIKVMANLIIGLPGESEASLEKMFDFVETSPVIPASIKYLTPFPGTPIFDEAVKRGLIGDPIEYLKGLSKRQVNNVKDDILNLTGLPTETLRAAFQKLTDIKNQRVQEAYKTDASLKTKMAARTESQKC